MSLKTIISRHRKSELKTGGHLVSIFDMFYLRNAQKELLKIDGFSAIVIKFKGETGYHDQLYVMDKSYRQKRFVDVLNHAKVLIEPGKPPDKKECVGKKLWIFIQEVHYVNNEVVVMEDGEPVIEYQIFKTEPIREGIIPKLKGDPLLNNGRAFDQFVTYKNKSSVFINEEDEWTPPTFE